MERVLRLLQDLGLHRDEARVYIYLAKKGPQTIKALEKNLEMNKNSIKGALKRLEEKQITTRKNEHSTVFLAITFEKLLTNYVKIQFNQAKLIEKKRISLMTHWLDMVEEKEFIKERFSSKNLNSE
jgi:sugar-specific transcriptional regulator TrmB